MVKSSKSLIKEAMTKTKQFDINEVIDNKEEFFLLDVREKEELETLPGIEGALHIPRGLLEFYADEESPLYDDRLGTDKTIVVFCAVGLRGSLAAKTLQEMGYSNVGNLKGGLNSLNK